MEYYLGDKKLKDADFRLSAIQVTDDGYYKARQQNLSPNRLDTHTFCPPEESNSIVLFVMEIKNRNSSWAKRWQRDKMEENLNVWMVDSDSVIDDATKSGNQFIVMKFPISELMTDVSIAKVLDKVNHHIQEITCQTII